MSIDTRKSRSSSFATPRVTRAARESRKTRKGTKKEEPLLTPLLRGSYLRLPMSLTIDVVTLKFLLGIGRNGETFTL